MMQTEHSHISPRPDWFSLLNTAWILFRQYEAAEEIHPEAGIGNEKWLRVDHADTQTRR